MTVCVKSVGLTFQCADPRALLEGEGGPSGQSQSGCRAVTGDVKAVGDGGFWRLELRLGAGVGV